VSCGRPDCESHDGGSALPPGGRALCSTGIRTFVDALEKVAHLNDVSRSRPGWLQSWQHSTIANRVEFLERVMADRSLETRFQRRVGLVKWGLVLSLATVILILVGIGGWNALFL
jgi:STE24 endopeptidase